MKTFKSWDDLEIAYQEWGEEQTLVLVADPSFTRSIVDFVA